MLVLFLGFCGETDYGKNNLKYILPLHLNETLLGTSLKKKKYTECMKNSKPQELC